MRSPAILLSALLLNACGPAAPKPAEPAATAAVEKPDPNRWAFAIGPDSVELAWMTEVSSDNPPLRLICARNGGLTVMTSAFTPIASEERLSIGAGSEPVALAAVVLETRDGPVIKATGVAEEPFLTALEAGGPIAASYGAQHYGPLATPGAAERRAFAETCRKLNGGTQA